MGNPGGCLCAESGTRRTLQTFVTDGFTSEEELMIVCRRGLGLSPPPLIRLIPDFDSGRQAEATWLTRRRAEPFDLSREIRQQWLGRRPSDKYTPGRTNWPVTLRYLLRHSRLKWK